MPDVELVLRSTRVITPEGTRAASVAVAGGTVTAVLPHDAPVPAGTAGITRLTLPLASLRRI